MKFVQIGKPVTGTQLKTWIIAAGLYCSVCMPLETLAQFKSVSDLHQTGEGGVLLGGVIADTAQWSATFFAATSAALNCTSTAIGPRIILLAAHCLPAEGAITIQSKFGSQAEQTIQSDRCAVHPNWSVTGNMVPDIALCRMQKIVPITKYESLVRTIPVLNVGNSVSLLGFGCMGIDPDGKPIYDRTLRVGEAKIEQWPSDSERGRNSFIVTRGDMTAGEAALCYGDSGGAAYTDTSEVRKILAINARANIKDRSYLSPVWSTEVRRFIVDFVVAVGEQACGVNEGVGLRGACR